LASLIQVSAIVPIAMASVSGSSSFHFRLRKTGDRMA